MTVLTLPSVRAGVTTPCWLAVIRSIVTANSRAMITIATHAAKRPSETRVSRAPMTSSLSASGSISLPKVVIDWRRRASQPSTASVIDATANTIAASRSPLGVWSSSATTSTGTSRMRSTVRTFGTLIGNIASPSRYPAGDEYRAVARFDPGRGRRRSGLQPTTRAEQPRAPGHRGRGQHGGDAEREPDRDVGGPEEPVADGVDEGEDRIGVRDLPPRLGGAADGGENAPEGGEGGGQEVVDEPVGGGRL